MQGANAHGHVPTFVHQIHHRIGQAQLYDYGRVLDAEIGHERRKMAHTVGQRRVEPQQAGGQGALGGGGSVGFVDFGQDAQHRLQIIGASVSKRQLAGAAVQEFHAQTHLQGIHMFGGHGR